MARKIAPDFFDCEAAYVPTFYNDRGGVRFYKNEEVKALLQQVGIEKFQLPQVIVPVGLRWRLSPNIGLPFSPFYVWRKPKKSALPSIGIDTYTNGQFVYFLNGPFYRASFSIRNFDAIDHTYSIIPLDAKYNDYKGKRIDLFVSAGSTSPVLMDQSNIGGLKIQGGNFAFENGNGITVHEYINDPEWKLIQVVGLPYTPGAIDTMLYNDEKQGFIDSLTDPETALRQRVDLYRLFYRDPLTTAPDGNSLPAWKIPNGEELLKSYKQISPIRNGQTGVLNDIREMLQMVYQSAPALYVGRQKNFLKHVESLGIVDPANGSPQENGRYKNPVCSSTLMSATTDCWHALGLGFGTIDFLSNSGSNFAAAVIRGDLHVTDYMITAKFRTPVINYIWEFPAQIKEKFEGFEENEYAALCHFDISAPPATVALQADTIDANRPLIRDDNFYKSVRLSWMRPDSADKSPLCYAVAFRNNLTAVTRFLNDERLFIEGTHLPFVPAQRSDEDAPELAGRDGTEFDRFFHDRSPVPFSGTLMQQYYVASQNVFGLWSNWSACNHILQPEPVQIPRLVTASFTSKHQGVTNHIYPGSRLEIVFSYDWDDRTPFEVQFAGYFLSPPVANPPVTVNGVVLSNSGGTMERYVVRFNGAEPIVGKIDAANVFTEIAQVPGDLEEASVIIDPSSSSGSGDGINSSNADIRTYRLILRNVTLNFTSQTKAWFALYIRGSELRDPARYSDYCKPVVIAVADPVAREAPTFTPEIRWASLPDASNISRYHLKFTPVTGAVGYAVYRATEMSVRDRMILTSEYPSNGSVFQKRDALNAAPATEKVKAIDAFIRVNKNMITTPTLEVEMDGDTQGLFLYAVSSFTEQGAESELSDWVYVAVPRKITPAPPVLTGFVNKRSLTPSIILQIEPGAGNNTSTVELYRSFKQYLAADINMMGLPLETGPVAGWNKYKFVDGINDELITADGESFDYFKIEHPVSPGWAPFYFRAAGLGLNEPSNGKLPGRSSSSNLLELLPPTPAEPPLIQNASLTADAGETQLRLAFQTNAYVGRSVYGNHLVQLFRQNSSGLWDEVASEEIPFILKVQPPTAEPTSQLIRLNGASQFNNYAYSFPIEEKITMKIVVADPLGRSSTAMVSYERPAPTTGVVITDIAVKVTAGAVNVRFRTNVGKHIPILGINKLEMLLGADRMERSILNVAMHKIPDVLPLLIGSGIAGGTTQDAEGMYTYAAFFRGAFFIKAFNTSDRLIIRITDPGGQVFNQIHSLS